MTNSHFIILYVTNVEASAVFYANLLDHAPIESSPTFAMFKLESGMMLGLWARHTVSPTSTIDGGGNELAFAVAHQQEVDTRYQQWQESGITIIQTPVDLDFGYTFVGIDPDGHRLRVFAAHQ